MAIVKSFREQARERSGTSIVDSGGVYGYLWQRPAIPEDMPLEYASPYSYVDADGKRVIEANLAISTAVLLDDTFEIDERQTTHFRRWCEITNPPGEPDRNWFDLATEYVTRMLAKGKAGDNADGIMKTNTYNYDNDMDQVVEFISPGLYADWHIVMIHTGCDVRGGYADPVVARGDLEEVLCSDRISLYCRRCDTSADSLYDADSDGWKPRLNKRSVAMICPKCKRVATTFPISPVQLAEDAAKAAQAAQAS